MKQNPNERYADAAEFREALRQLGRTEDVAEAKGSQSCSEAEQTAVEISEATLVAADQTFATGALSSRTLAALFVLLIVSFGIFCRYYPWKMPSTINQETAAIAASLVQPKHVDDRGAEKSRNRRNAVALASVK